MKSATCLRQACQCVPLPTSASTARGVGSRSWRCHQARVRSTWSAHEPRTRASRRAFSSATDAPKATSRFSQLEEQRREPERVSPFKEHRQNEFRQDQGREQPLWPELYPRLQNSETRKTIPDFVQEMEESSFETEESTLSDEPGEEITLMGRVRAKRELGKSLVFLDIVNEFQMVQITLNQRKCMPDEPWSRERFDIFKKLIQVGDHISVTGVQGRSKAGKPLLQAVQLPELLSPAMEQIPNELTDAKTKMQERHVDMLVNKEVLHVLRLRSEITKHMRDYFHSKRFLEFQTPILAENAGGATARPFVTNASEFRDKDLALRIAPELWLKRLVVGGVDKVFEIGPAFRNEGVDATHNPEFTMCEFYSAYTNLPDLINETEELMYSLAKHCEGLISTELTSLQPIELSRFMRPFKQIEFVPALEEAMGLRLPKLSSQDALPGVLTALKLAGVKVPGEVPDTLPKLLDRLAAVYLEPESFKQPIFVINHPACMSPLAKSFVCPQTYQLVSARAELFVGGRELANMYEEENNPQEQRRKMLEHRGLVNHADGSVVYSEAEAGTDDVEITEGVDEEAPPLDDSYIKALEYGLPPTGGWGCGVERLVMLFSGANRISDCLSFGTLRNVVGLSADDGKAQKRA